MRIEIRDNSVEISGYVNVPGKDSRTLPSPKGPFKEQIMPKTFERALGKAENVNLLLNHKSDRKLGSTKEGNLELYEDNVGLRAITTITDEEVIQLAKRGALQGWSFAFIANKDTWDDGKDGIQRRYVEDLDLLEVSILSVTPAYVATSIEARGDETVIIEQRNEESKSELAPKKGEKREELVDYSLFEIEIEILKLRGSR
jgi:HK97 family phage prohead protease